MRKILLLLLAVVLSSCTSPDAGPPPVDLEFLAPLVAELQVAEALSTEVPILVRDSMKEEFFDRVLADHHTDRATFDSLTWIIREEPSWIDSLYSKVSVILAKKKANEKAKS